ncbi:MAG TPA: hypothetical protein VHX37_11715 [Acidobacteriaceae bacterium]|nr:hypothetical protein [Acidobacteriaceae bacterium]
MSRLVALLVFGACLFSQHRLLAQVTATAPETEAPQYTERWDLYGGAQYSHFNPSPGTGVHAINLLGWNGSATAWFRPLIGLEASARGLSGDMAIQANSYGVPASPAMSEKLFLFGPSFRLLRRPHYALGMHGLVGAAYGVFDTDFPSGITPQMVGIYNNKLTLGVAMGGFADYNLSSRLAVRFVSDWQPTHYGFPWQNEFAGSVGIVYKVGSLHIR